MAAGLRPDPLGQLKCSPDPLAAIRGPTSKGRVREGMEGSGKGGEGGRRGGSGREEKGKGRGNLLQGVRGDRRPADGQTRIRTPVLPLTRQVLKYM